VIVTISNEYGSGAVAIAQRVARVLDYDYVDRQLPVVVATRLGITSEAVDASEDSQQTLGERLINSLERATPELAEASTADPIDEKVLAAVQSAVLEHASRGDCVIIGRGASAILGARADVLRVFMYAPRERRVTHVAERTGMPPQVAEVEVDRLDRARSAYVRQWYGQTFGDPRNYDLCLDTSRLDTAQSVAAIVAAVQARS
jgi:cytidylate kinase